MRGQAPVRISLPRWGDVEPARRIGRVHEQFMELRAQHQRKPSLLDRFDKAGLPR